MKNPFVLPLSDPHADPNTVGGKGASLARLANAGLPIPDGFHVTTEAYRRFVDENKLQPKIEAALQAIDLSAPQTLEEASQVIRALFLQATLPPQVTSAIAAAYTALSEDAPAVAVRSSATAEDLPEASFAGQQDTFLNIRGVDPLLQATRACWASLWTGRAIGYRARREIAADCVALAVVVQHLIPAEAAGILFTANPVNGNRHQAVISAAWGLGEAVVGGLVTPDSLTLDKNTHRVLERQTADKQWMTVRLADGTKETPVPENLRRVPVLNDTQAAELVQLGVQIERLYQSPQDIEWAISEGKIYLLQSRPITTLTEPAADDEQNATFTGDYLWTNMIVGEVFPTTTTPSTWSVWQDFFSKLSFGEVPAIGNIAGRPYLNYSLAYSFLIKLTRKHERVMTLIQDSIGVPPKDMDIPSFPIPWSTVLFQVLPQEFQKELKKGRLKRTAPEYLTMVRNRCSELHQQIEAARQDTLIVLWRKDIQPLWNEIHLLQDKMNEELQALTRQLKTTLTRRLGAEDNLVLLTTISNAGELASLGPLVGLYRLMNGTLSRPEYLQQYGHRGPYENELAEPRPHENPAWLDQQLTEFGKAPVDVAKMLEKRDAEFEVARQAIMRRLSPRDAQDVAHQIAAIVRANTLREATRSELTRVLEVIRIFFLRGGKLSELGGGVFFLTIDELVAVLSGDRTAVTSIPARQRLYERYKALPPLPGWIRGRFEPFQWAADPNRRGDVFDARASQSVSAPGVEKVIRGHPGSAGRVEGRVRRIDHPEQGFQLQPAEILVTSTTNVGWTPLFPRAAAVVTDIGGSLSHAAIVARELGIPAVVGCGDATLRLQTGDHVRVDGARGTIEILETTQE